MTLGRHLGRLVTLAGYTLFASGATHGLHLATHHAHEHHDCAPHAAALASDQHADHEPAHTEQVDSCPVCFQLTTGAKVTLDAGGTVQLGFDPGPMQPGKPAWTPICRVTERLPAPRGPPFTCLNRSA